MAWKKNTSATEDNAKPVNNLVSNLWLKCWEINQSEDEDGNASNILRMRCGFGGGKKEDGNYKKEIPVTVWVNLEGDKKCEIEERDDYEGSIIVVDGTLSSREWTSKDTGKTSAYLNLNATRVAKVEFNK